MPDPVWGAYTTSSLVRAASVWARGHNRARRDPAVLSRFFAPFPVGGLTWWTDTWGAPRYAGGYHPHHGQDLLCAEGTPLLAVEPGVVHLGSDPLGGTSLQLIRTDGGFWYYAHLSAYADGITEGSTVRTGQVIGFCGATGDASVSHLHFARFTADGRARNPMRWLLKWLGQAEVRAGATRNDPGRPPPGLTTAETTDPSLRWIARLGPEDPSGTFPDAPLQATAPGAPKGSPAGPAAAAVLAAAMMTPFLLTSRRVRLWLPLGRRT